MLTKENATEAWVDQEVTIPSVNNLKVCYVTTRIRTILSIYLDTYIITLKFNYLSKPFFLHCCEVVNKDVVCNE